ncbi:MAG: hypothetical protein ACR2OZ_05150 [Verrucomicrobiales bacterium]
MAAFTSPEASGLSVKIAAPSEIAALQEKLDQFAKNVDAGEGPSLSLSTEELNTMLAGFPRFESVKPVFLLQKISSERMSAQVSLPMNSMPGRRAFLNGTIHFQPVATREVGLHMRAESIEVPGKTVPQGFLEIYQRGVIPGKTFGFLDDMLVRNFRADKAVGRYLRQIEAVSLSEDAVTVRASPGTPPKDEE